METERLILRKFKEEDLPEYALILGEDEVGKWLPKGVGYTYEETEKFIKYWNDHWETHGYGTWAVFEKSSGKLCGHCGLNYIKDLDEVEVLYAFGKHARGKGFGTEAAKVILYYGIHHLQLNRIIGLSKQKNKPSRRVLEKIGLTYSKEIERFNTKLAYYSLL
ncbi:GNAT family N-acetyltransferase [Ammoniphilus sp. YIM 78166]|uniref:GNAT family N-acetyltransferase n=1 Tax=Ammoniphilus sp. YIM 78166 TaxID=1644106 RepID=UPI001070699A|nr:GNAT family N-acetyltransferase [Ammoniphilus sp. YIM 78166]